MDLDEKFNTILYCLSDLSKQICSIESRFCDFDARLTSLERERSQSPGQQHGGHAGPGAAPKGVEDPSTTGRSHNQ